MILQALAIERAAATRTPLNVCFTIIRALYFNGAAHGIQYAAELGQQMPARPRLLSDWSSFSLATFNLPRTHPWPPVRR